MRTVIALLLAAGCATGCAIDAPVLDARNPASPAAPTGRLAGASPTLRPGVVAYPDVPALRTGPPPMHHHHGS